MLILCLWKNSRVKVVPSCISYCVAGGFSLDCWVVRKMLQNVPKGFWRIFWCKDVFVFRIHVEASLRKLFFAFTTSKPDVKVTWAVHWPVEMVLYNQTVKVMRYFFYFTLFYFLGTESRPISPSGKSRLQTVLLAIFFLSLFLVVARPCFCPIHIFIFESLASV